MIDEGIETLISLFIIMIIIRAPHLKRNAYIHLGIHVPLQGYYTYGQIFTGSNYQQANVYREILNAFA